MNKYSDLPYETYKTNCQRRMNVHHILSLTADLLPGDPWRQRAAGPGPGLEAGEALVLGPHGLDTLRHGAASLGG